jgi:hypothetical protein
MPSVDVKGFNPVSNILKEEKENEQRKVPTMKDLFVPVSCCVHQFVLDFTDVQ